MNEKDIPVIIGLADKLVSVSEKMENEYKNDGIKKFKDSKKQFEKIQRKISKKIK